jgi:tRNA(adenine34) deaminase
MFSCSDVKFMKVALVQAENALHRNDLPIGAALVINGQLAGVSSNQNTTNKSWVSHAEVNVLLMNAAVIREAVEMNGAKVELFTTLEPCLMCLGMALFSRVSRIVYALRDSAHGFAAANSLIRPLTPASPLVVEGGILAYESQQLFERYQPRYPFEPRINP